MMADEKASSSGAFLPPSLMYFCSGQPMYFCSGVDMRGFTKSVYTIRFILAQAFFLFVFGANAAGKLYYGSREGMHVTVISCRGLILLKRSFYLHSRADAIAYCPEYVVQSPKSALEKSLLHDRTT